MAKVLDTYSAGTLADAIGEFLEDLGFPPEEAIPGLIIAIGQQAHLMRFPSEALDEAANLLAEQ